MAENSLTKKNFISQDTWQSLRAYTSARIALGRTGTSTPLIESLQFKLAHAHARDAVYSTLAIQELIASLQQFHLPVFLLHSKANEREIYLKRPDWGRRLNDDSEKQLLSFSSSGYDIAITIADGLSAIAVNEHTVPLLQILVPLLRSGFSLAPFCVAEQARVALSDEVGYLLKAKLSLILIGERPGLSSPDSLGGYITYHPVVGLTDESRNCISNIRKEGLSYQLAADKIFYLVNESFRFQLSGIGLKDNSGLLK